MEEDAVLVGQRRCLYWRVSEREIAALADLA